MYPFYLQAQSSERSKVLDNYNYFEYLATVKFLNTNINKVHFHLEFQKGLNRFQMLGETSGSKDFTEYKTLLFPTPEASLYKGNLKRNRLRKVTFSLLSKLFTRTIGDCFAKPTEYIKHFHDGLETNLFQPIS